MVFGDIYKFLEYFSKVQSVILDARIRQGNE
jgi:hypothetical protein